MRRMILACSVLLALSGGATAGQIYKWVDSQGNVHFGSQPPQGQDADTVNPNISHPRVAAPAAETAPAEGDKQQEAIDKEVRQNVAKQEAERRKFCESVRYNLAQLKNTPRIRTEVDGEVRRLTEEERQERIAKAEASIKENCQ